MTSTALLPLLLVVIFTVGHLQEYENLLSSIPDPDNETIPAAMNVEDQAISNDTGLGKSRLQFCPG
jgi:hypothetical protein